MTYRKVNKIPHSINGRCYHKLGELLSEFMSLDYEIIEIDPVEENYSQPRYCRTSLSAAIKLHGYSGRIFVQQVGNKIYLLKSNTRRFHYDSD